MVENFGTYLKHERELRGVPLEEIAEATKIHIRFLEALENNELDLLPGEVFIKGYIRSYAKVIGIDGEDMVNTYDESAGKDRKEESKKVQITNEKIRSRKNTQMGFTVAGIALTGIFILAYWVANFGVEKNNLNSTQLLPASDASLAWKDSESISNREPPQDEIFKEENSGLELQAESLDKEPSSSKISADTKSDPARQSSLSSTSLKKPSESPKTGANNTEMVAIGPRPQLSPFASQEENKKEPETLIKSAESKKESDIPEKDVIIQQVAEISAAGNSEPEASESDSKPLHLKIQVQGNSWFNVTVDGDGKEDFILPGGSIKNIYGSEHFRLTIGNRQGTHLFLNGQSIDLPPGSDDVIRDFNITANLIE